MRVPVAINEAEAVLEPFWDARISPLPLYGLEPPDGGPGRARLRQDWCWAALSWDAAPAGRPALVMARDLEVDLSGYDTLLVRLAAPPHVRLTVRAETERGEAALLEGEPGRGDPHEFEAPLRGRVLRRLELALETDRDGPEELWLGWIGVAHAGRREAMLSRPNPFGEAWEGNLLPPNSAVEHAPRYGFFFDAGELEAVRARARSPLYAPVMEQLRARAREAMRCPAPPESQIGSHYATYQWKYLIREREYGNRPYFIDAPVCAFVGLVDGNAEAGRFAARILLSILHTERWNYTFQQGFPGSSWDIRGFPEAFLTASVAMTADWAGSWLTGKAEDLLRSCVAAKGLPMVEEALLRWDYMWGCNQGQMIGLGRVLGFLLLERSWPRAAEGLERCRRDLAEMVLRYIRPDGSSHEGIQYWSHSLRATLPAFAALARRSGTPAPEAAMERIAAAWNYIAALSSTAGQPGTCLPVADTVGDRIALDAIGMMSAALGGPWTGLLGACLRRGSGCSIDWLPDGAFTVIYGPDAVPDADPRPPALIRLPDSGMASGCRPWSGGLVRLFLVGAAADAGHGHRDKGSFILEADGEVFCADRGMAPYQDSANVPFLKSEEAHNLAVPEDVRQRNPSPFPSVWEAEGDERRLLASVDTGRTWEEPVLGCRRIVDSPRPDFIGIVDEIDLAEPRAIRFHLQTPLPLEAGASAGAVLHGRHSDLTVEAPWAVLRMAGPCGTDWSGRPMNRLTLVSAPAREHRLRTTLRLVHR